jgi:hypothetical protein
LWGVMLKGLSVRRGFTSRRELPVMRALSLQASMLWESIAIGIAAACLGCRCSLFSVMNGWWHPRQMSGGEELSPRLPSLVSAWASVTKFEMIRRAWASHALLFTTPIYREGGEIARWDIYSLTRTVGVRVGKDATLEPERSSPREAQRISFPLRCAKPQQPDFESPGQRTRLGGSRGMALLLEFAWRYQCAAPGWRHT